MAQLLSEKDPKQAESNIKNFSFGPSINIVVETLWDQATQSYFNGMFASAAIVSGTCAEAAHRFYCSESGIGKNKVKNMKWEALINYSASKKVIDSPIQCVLNRIRTDYRNMWVHVDLDKITKADPMGGAGMGKSVTALVLSQQQSLDCLWLTVVVLSRLYGTMPVLFEPSCI